MVSSCTCRDELDDRSDLTSTNATAWRPYRIFKVDPANSYNGINALPDGTTVVKSLYRVAGCTLNGPSTLLTCPDARNVPASNLISVNPKTMQIIDNITLPAFAGGISRAGVRRGHPLFGMLGPWDRGDIGLSSGGS